ncbi:HAD domain-containing protein [Aquabacterium sp.]|uniref:HAD domain-containing protein n=1 Tax=Aquabacterium sp. TaxID=1872578 RepID=UPI0024899D39|nr:HAD domain-containing protein [Aquabacterium sp.]MDI1258259.1 HAD domain-containing protein [Aquabacterium sp.]
MKRPILFLDFDDVICLNAPYGGYDVFAPNKPSDLYERLFAPQCTTLLLEVLKAYQPQVVLTTSWLRLMDREGFESLFSRTGLELVSTSLQEHWSATQNRGWERVAAIDSWLSNFHDGEPYVIFDDECSGTGLKRSRHDRAKRLVLCGENVGLQEGHLALVAQALTTPARRQQRKQRDG